MPQPKKKGNLMRKKGSMMDDHPADQGIGVTLPDVLLNSQVCLKNPSQKLIESLRYMMFS